MTARESERQEYAEYAAARWLTLVRAGVSLGCDRTEAEDLAQATLVRCYVHWGKVRRATHRDAYVSTILLHAFRDSRRPRWRREALVAETPDHVVPDFSDEVDTTDALRRALAGLNQGQREVVVLRYLIRLPESQIATVLDIAPGTVKSRLSRALTTLAADTGLNELREELR